MRTAVPVVPNHPPQATACGRLILSGNISFPYTDDAAGLDGWVMTGIYGDAFAGRTLRDDPDSIHMVTPANGWECTMICEGSFYETDDRVLHMLLRSCTDRLWVSESRDGGEHWSNPQPTDFSNDSSKFHCGQLPDGRYYTVSSPCTDRPGARCPLVLSLYGKVDMGMNYGSILAWLLLACACMAVGVFFSSVTENQIVAALLSFAVLLLAYLMQGIASLVGSSAGAAFAVFAAVSALVGLLVWYMTRSRFLALAVGLAGLAALGVLYVFNSAAVTAALASVLGALALFAPFTGFVSGIFSLSAPVYYLSVIVLFLFLTVRILDKKRWA